MNTSVLDFIDILKLIGPEGLRFAKFVQCEIYSLYSLYGFCTVCTVLWGIWNSGIKEDTVHCTVHQID